MFVDRLGGNLRLQPNSPGINTGNNAYVQGSTDRDGRPRIVDGTVDLGAYESQPGASGAFIGWLQSRGLPTDGSVDTADLDGDHMNNREEWLADTDPTNAISCFQIESIGASSPATVSFLSSPNRTYTLWRANRLDPPDWTAVPGQQTIPGNGDMLTLSDDKEAPQLFHRVEVSLP